ncbi:tRNA pseudouridine synthase, partial [Pavlovales sp. CCMP2436]
REFDFSKYAERQIALKISYDGRTYDGLARLDGNDNTVEGQLLVALEKTCLIRGRLECKLSKAGRTDKGVSSSGNVVAVLVRTNRPLGTSKGAPDVEEIDYATRLNAVLPSQIRVLRWAPVDERFSARFSAKHRVYRYFFLKGTLDLELMRQAASAFVGTHDFRNFCKADVEHVLSFERTLHSFGVSPVAGHFAQDAECCADPRLQLCAFTIKGRAFLWHQVRCMVAVLFLVGQGFESPEVVAKLLDIEAEPCKPQYALASDMPLVLHEIGY